MPGPGELIRIPLDELHDWLVEHDQRIAGGEWLPIAGAIVSGNKRVGYERQARLRVRFAACRPAGESVKILRPDFERFTGHGNQKTASLPRKSAESGGQIGLPGAGLDG